MKTGQKLELENPSTGEIFRKLTYNSWDEVKTKLSEHFLKLEISI